LFEFNQFLIFQPPPKTKDTVEFSFCRIAKNDNWLCLLKRWS